MTTARFVQIAGLLAVTAVLGSMATANAQTAQAPSALKTIGTPSTAAKPEIVPALFIDIIGRPFTPLSFAGVARRTAFRGAMYAGAVGAAAYGAAAYYHPYAYAYPRPACGYYPYPPCY